MDVLHDFLFSDKYWFYRNAAAILGTVVVGRIVLRTLCDMVSGFRAFFLAPMGVGRTNLHKYGSWAVVTGASDGIGRGYALELARQGLNVVLMSRSEEKLNKVAAEIKEIGGESLVIPVDFSGGMDIYTMISDQLKDLDIGVVVNNVGVFLDYPNLMDKIPAERLYKVIQVNCQAIVQMSHVLLPKMVGRGGGVIVNISSATSLLPLAHYNVYSATKMFVNYISDGMRKEYGSKGIIVQNVRSFFVATTMSGVSQPSFAVPSPIAYAKAAVATIGVQNDTFGCFSHALQGYALSSLPDNLADMVGNKSADLHKGWLLRHEDSKKTT